MGAKAGARLRHSVFEEYRTHASNNFSQFLTPCAVVHSEVVDSASSVRLMKPLHVVVVLSLVLAAASPAFSQTRFSDVDPYLGDAANWQPLHAARWSVVMDGGGLRYGIDTTSYSERSGSRLGEYSLVKGRTYGDFAFSADEVEEDLQPCGVSE